jgi:riboflavin kinase/FMN adenylyltransferase
MEKFDSVDDLIVAMGKDAERARAILAASEDVR